MNLELFEIEIHSLIKIIQILWNDLEEIEQLSHELSRIGIACQNIFC